MPNMVPPRLSAASAERMQAVVGAADDAVDGGAHPNLAIAKAARDHNLPVSHVPVVVRAFNTGRAVRQFGADDPWTKAAAHPVATAEGVIAELNPKPVQKQAVDLSHYNTPPAVEARVLLPLVEKKAAVKQPAAPAPVVTKPAKDSRLSTEFAAAAAFDKAAELTKALTPTVYSAVKKAAFSVSPDAAKFFFDILETDDAAVLAHKAASVKPDVSITTEHPVVRAVIELGRAKSAYVVPTDTEAPYGFAEAKRCGQTVFFTKLAVCPILGTPIKPTVPDPPPAPPQAKTAWELDVPKASAEEGSALPQLINKWSPESNFGKAFKTVGLGPIGALAGSRFLGPALNVVPSQPEDEDTKVPGLEGTQNRLKGDLKRLDDQTALQDVLSDPRFRSADPKTVLGAYHQLSALAPMAIRNPMIAGDFIQRRLQTGPLSYFDTAKLVEIEKNLQGIHRRDLRPRDEDN